MGPPTPAFDVDLRSDATMFHGLVIPKRLENFELRVREDQGIFRHDRIRDLPPSRLSDGSHFAKRTQVQHHQSHSFHKAPQSVVNPPLSDLARIVFARRARGTRRPDQPGRFRVIEKNAASEKPYLPTLTGESPRWDTSGYYFASPRKSVRQALKQTSFPVHPFKQHGAPCAEWGVMEACFGSPSSLGVARYGGIAPWFARLPHPGVRAPLRFV